MVLCIFTFSYCMCSLFKATWRQRTSLDTFLLWCTHHKLLCFPGSQTYMPPGFRLEESWWGIIILFLTQSRDFFAFPLSQSGFRKENRSHSMYSKFKTAAALHFIPVFCPQYLSPLPSDTFPLLSSKSHWCFLLTDQNLKLYRKWILGNTVSTICTTMHFSNSAFILTLLPTINF